MLRTTTDTSFALPIKDLNANANLTDSLSEIRRVGVGSAISAVMDDSSDQAYERLVGIAEPVLSTTEDQSDNINEA